MNIQELKGRVALVSGASSGIGRAVVRSFAANGIFVVANARRIMPLNKLVQEFNGESIKVATVVGDIASEEVVDKLINTALLTFGAEADIIVANAGRGLAGSLLSSNANEWEELIRVNLIGCMRLIRAAAQRLLAHAQEDSTPSKARDIVILGSSVGRHISPFSSVYGSTKFAVNSLAEALRRELGPKNIRVTLIEPGIVKTEFQSVAGYDAKWFTDFAESKGPILDPDDIARLVLFVLGQPPHVHINDVVIRPTRQDYP